MIISSDLGRAVQTSNLIINENHYSSVNQIHYTEKVRERSFGVFEGRPKKEFSKFLEKMNDEFENVRDICPENGESLSDLNERSGHFLEELADIVQEEPSIKNILVISHKNFICEAVNYVTGLNGTETDHENVEITNCCLNQIFIVKDRETDQVEFEIGVVNDRKHLIAQL